MRGGSTNMGISTRLKRLKALAAASKAEQPLTAEERQGRIAALLAYRGNDADLLRRQERLMQLVQEWRDETTGAGGGSQ
jgi:hypothetical protein